MAVHLLTNARPGHKKGPVNEQMPDMTSSRLLKIFAALSLLATLAAVWSWRTSGEPPDHWLIRIAVASFLAALVMSFVNVETRPRLMLRFMAALFALFSLIAFAADVSRAPVDGNSLGAISLLQHLQTLAPSFVAALEKSISRSLGPVVWDPILTSLLSLPATLIFLILAVGAGYLGRPRRRVRIFINDY